MQIYRYPSTLFRRRFLSKRLKVPNFVSIHLSVGRLFPHRHSGFGEAVARTRGCQRAWSPRRDHRSWTRTRTLDPRADILARGAVVHPKGHGYGAIVRTRWASSWLRWHCEHSRLYMSGSEVHLLASCPRKSGRRGRPFSTPFFPPGLCDERPQRTYHITYKVPTPLFFCCCCVFACGLSQGRLFFGSKIGTVLIC